MDHISRIESVLDRYSRLFLGKGAPDAPTRKEFAKRLACYSLDAINSALDKCLTRNRVYPTLLEIRESLPRTDNQEGVMEVGKEFRAQTEKREQKFLELYGEEALRNYETRYLQEAGLQPNKKGPSSLFRPLALLDLDLAEGDFLAAIRRAQTLRLAS